MKKKLFILIFTVVMLLLCALEGNAAFSGVVPRARADVALPGAWVISADGKSQLSGGSVFALTSGGLAELETVVDTGTPGTLTGVGGGGLLFDNGRVRVAADRIKVGLRYFYSDKRDSSMEVAYLENAVGSGYAFGWLDRSRGFVQNGAEAVTSETQLTIMPLGGTGVGIYSTKTGDLLYSTSFTGRDAYLAVHPLCADGDAVTWFAKNRYCGDFAYADLGNGKLTVVNVVDVEHYVMGVCSGEMGASFPLEALKAQAVAARTYAMYYVHNGAYNIPFGFDLTCDDYSQVYLGYTTAESLISAAMETRNQYLTYNGQIIEALFSAADGGETLNSEEVFATAMPYLRGFEDPYEASAWTRGRFGHGVGLSQWGAYAMANTYHYNYKDILGFYYTKVGLSIGYLQ